eukprot:g12225.t1
MKVTTSRTRAWHRKLKFILKTQRGALRGVVLLGLSLHTDDKVFCHLVHRCNKYDCADMTHPDWNCRRDELVGRIRTLLADSSTPTHADPARAFVYSTATLVEVDARNDFASLLEGTPVKYEVEQTEFSTADAVVFLENKPQHKYKVQEKVTSWRFENDIPLGLRASLRRWNGQNYAPGDADFLLLHARASEVNAHSPFRVHGSALISWEELEQHGFLHTSEGSPGCGSLSMYPKGCPGVRCARETWLEERFKTRDELAAEIQAILEERTQRDEQQSF